MINEYFLRITPPFKFKTMNVTITEIPTTTYEYKYEFTDDLGVVTRVEGIENLDNANKHIKAKLKKMKKENYNIKLIK